MATAPSNVTGYTSRHCDGTPGLEHFAHATAFAWSGSLADPVEVSHGGYGEPVEHLIDLRAETVIPAGLGEAMAWFAKVCDEWFRWAATGDISLDRRRLLPRAGHCGCVLPVWTEFDTETAPSRMVRGFKGVYLLRTAAVND